MTRIVKLIFLSIGILVNTGLIAQTRTGQVLMPEQFLEIVMQHHPVAIQSQIVVEKGETYVKKARGGFDPKLFGDAYQKYFSGSQYYSILEGGLKVPTWFGVEVNAGYSVADGTRLNPQNYTPTEGLWHLGVSVPLGKNLVIDARRAELKQAKIYRESTKAQQQIILNKLLYDASLVYWNWMKAFNQMKVYERAVANAKVRLDGVKKSASMGDKPFIDTLESNINLQNRQFDLINYELYYENASAQLEVFLWKEGYIPLELTDSLFPPGIETIVATEMSLPVFAMLDTLASYHPELQKYQYEIDMAKVDLKLSREQLKPTVNLKFNALNTGGNEVPWSDYTINNYQWGAEVKFPLFIRKERGELRLNTLELENLEANYANKQAEQTYKVWTYINTWQTSLEQIEFSKQIVSQYETLLKGEQTLFNTGESSVFMINTREKQLIKAELAFIDAMILNQKARLSTEFTLGILAL